VAQRGRDVFRSLQFHDHDGHAVQEKDDVWAARVAAIDFELAYGEPVVLPVFPIHESRKITPNLVPLPELDLGALHQKVMDALVLANWVRQARVSNLADSLIDGISRKVRVQPDNSSAQAVYKDYVTKGFSLSAGAVRSEIPAMSAREAKAVEKVQDVLFDVIFDGLRHHATS